ncbi:hypothetical protein CEQ90_12165 [Lewinellaceae bacterium SD302]|nr:hypothetical protein CEQ90_12165 [Lewinellaceae bacterium SD302]
MNKFIHLDQVGDVRLRVMGSGPRAVIALHGFSRNGGIFGGLARRLERSHTFYAPDLPYHGETDWTTERYSPQQVSKLILAVKVAVGIDRAAFLGHSLGGRILLKLFGQGLLSPETAASLTLVAPDGLRGNYTGKLDMLPSGVVRALAWAGSRPDALLKLANFLHRRGLFDAYTLNYLTHHLRDARTQRMLLGTFRSLPAFQLGRTERAGIARLNVPIRTYLGSHDPLMNNQAVERWFADVPNTEVVGYRGHHSLPVEELAGYLA